MRLAELRNHVKTEYLNNNVISGKEAKDLVGLLAKDGLSTQEKRNLEKIRAEFKDRFSEAGLREFDKALARASASLPAPTGNVGSGGTVMDLRLGRTLPPVTANLRLSSVEDPAVRSALRRLDFNNDGKITDRDREKMGFSEPQWQSFLYFAALMGQKIEAGADAIPLDFAGKTVAFTAVPDKARAAEWASAMNARVVSDLDEKLDFLIVGASAGTGKDERAHALNALGVASIKVCDYTSFSDKAALAGVTGPAPGPLSAAELRAKIGETVDSWYEDHIRERYAWEMDEATTPAERARVREDLATDLGNGAEWSILSSGDWGYYEDVRNNPDGAEFRDRFGVPIPNSAVVEVSVDFSPEYAGIGLGTYMAFDGRTGEHLETGDIHD